MKKKVGENKERNHPLASRGSVSWPQFAERAKLVDCSPNPQADKNDKDFFYRKTLCRRYPIEVGKINKITVE